MAFHLLARDRDGARQIAEAIRTAIERIGHCRDCNDFSESEICPLCTSPRRDPALLCVVESPADLASIEQSGAYNGLYFVLMGRLSPLDGIGPDEIGIHRLEALLDARAVKEIVLATNLTVEGEATAHYISELLKARGIAVSRIARGLPMGGEIEYVDSGTLAQSILERRRI